MKIFLTGGTGFIGKNFIKLAKKKHYIFAPSRRIKKNIDNNIKWLLGSFEENWKKELSDSNILVHLAASGVNNNKIDNIYDVNLFKSSKLLQNAVKYNCKNWLIISSSSEYGIRITNNPYIFSSSTQRIPDTDYGLSKALFSDYCIKLAKKHNCKVRIMRLFPIYGTGENKNRLHPSLLKSIKKKKNFFLKNPNETRDFTNVNFTSKVLINALDFNKKKFRTSQVWHVSENKPKKIKDFVDETCNKNKSKIKVNLNKKNKKMFNNISNKNSVWKI